MSPVDDGFKVQKNISIRVFHAPFFDASPGEIRFDIDVYDPVLASVSEVVFDSPIRLHNGFSMNPSSR
jgi:hypothetical protein